MGNNCARALAYSVSQRQCGVALEGCVLVAESYAVFGDKPGVAMSGQGFEEFMKRTGDVDSFLLEVS